MSPTDLDPRSPPAPTRRHTTAMGVGLLLAALAWWGWWASAAWQAPGIVGHEFRQAQTAVSIQAMHKDGFHLAYATPILGKPWSIPMEFPLYQYATVKFGDVFGTTIIVSGRWVSALSFLVGVVAIFFLRREAGFSLGASALGTIPVVTAPVYLFYSRTVMIESMAWAASAWFLVGVLRFRRLGQRSAWLLAIGAGAIAVLVKATTWAAFCIPWAVLFLRDAGVALRHRPIAYSRLVIQAVGIGLPLLLLGWGWVAYADAVKSQNPLAHFLLSGELTRFNFGTWAMRTSAENWSTILQHWQDSSLPLWLLVTVALAALPGRTSRVILGLGLAGFIGIQTLFFGLYLFHDYYFYANGAMICLIAGAVAATSWDLRKLNQLGKLLAVGIVLAVAAVQFTNYRAKLYLDQTHNSTGDSTVFLAIRTLTEPGEVIVIHSPDWSSVPAFYAERRVLNIPDAQMFFHPDKVAQSLALLADESVPLVLFVRESRVHPTWLTDRIGDLNLWPLPLFESSTEITAYARADRYQAFKQQLAELQLAGLTIAQNPPLAPAEKRQPITDSPAAGEIAKAGLFPLYAVFPFDLLVSNHPDGPVLSTHAPTELYFAIPADAQSVTFEFGVNPAVLEEVDFDGIGVQLELVNERGENLVFHQEWIPPQSPESS